MQTFILQELLSWRAFLDILIITVALFLLCQTLVRFGTWKILVGILIAFFIFTIASLLRLEGVSWIFRNVSQVAVLAIIVIFQPELRKILEKFVSLSRSKRVPPDHGLTEIVASSLWKLAAQKRGALLVYPGEEIFTEKLSGGHALNGKASEPLMMSIFDPHSPGHDGAVLVEDNQLSRFGVRLPMSQTTRLAEDFGTRHHAAMSLAETTDALIFVVSEERGIVSAFKNGEMIKMRSPADISSQIMSHQTQYGLLGLQRFSGWDRRTAMQAGSCLFLAIVLWTTLAASNRQIVERTFVLPVTYTAPAENLMLISPKIDEVKIQMSGPKAALNDFLLSQPVVNVDLSGMVEGTQTILLSEENISGDEEVAFLSSTPDRIQVTLAQIIRTSLPVVPQLVGSLPPGLKITKVRVRPERIQVLVPPSTSDDAPLTVSTTPVYLNSVSASSRIFCKVIAAQHIQPVVRPWPDVEVLIEVSAAQ